MKMSKIASLGLALIAAPLSACAATPPPAATTGVTTQMIRNGDHKLAFHVIPGRSPVIVLDAGGGLDSSYWASFAPELAKQTGLKVISYDRASMGASDEVKGPWSLEGATKDLETGLKTLGATHDVILVSHSLAGEVATYLTRQHPAWFRGVVMVDANVPDFYTDEMIATIDAAYGPMVAQLKTAPSTPANRQLINLEESFVDTSRAFHKAVWPSSVPAIVIVSETTPMEDPSMAEAWRTAHAQFVKGAPNRKYVTAEKSSHDVVKDRPDIIRQAISDIIAQKP